jgi:hypothetical protein
VSFVTRATDLEPLTWDLATRFDEGDWRLVSSNKVVFQAGSTVTLGLSPCGQHTYAVPLAGVGLIVTTNSFWGAGGFDPDNELHVWCRQNSIWFQVEEKLY